MDEEMANLCFSLREAILKEEVIVKLFDLENKLSHNEEVNKLFYKTKDISQKYSALLNIYSPKSKVIKDVIKELSEAEILLNNHPLVKEYNLIYKKAYEYLKNLEDIIFLK